MSFEINLNQAKSGQQKTGTVKDDPPKPDPAPRQQKDEHPDYCPARCKHTDLCYGKTYFTGKTGRGTYCAPNNCKFKTALEEWRERNNDDK